MLFEPGYGQAFVTNSTGIRVSLHDRGLPVMLERKRRMNAKELSTKTADQLKDELVALKKEAFNLRFQQATNQLENTARMRAVRRDVARIKTVLNQKATEAAIMSDAK